jgi:transcriptional regulator with XRE-family HTH domain
VTFRISRHPEGTFGEKIRKFRLERGLRQKGLAILLGANEMTIVNWEMDRRKPSKRHMERLRELGVWGGFQTVIFSREGQNERKMGNTMPKIMNVTT